MDETGQLYVVDCDYGLVSFDVDCIQSIFLARLNKLPVKICIANNLRSCAFYNTPSLYYNGKVVVNGFDNIMSDLKRLDYNIDHKLTAKQCSEMLALTNLVSMKLKPVIDFLYWLDQRNCDEFVSLWYMKALPFPFNYSYIKRRKGEALNMLETLYPLDSNNLELVKGYMLTNATNCLSALSTRLGETDYFFDNSPTSLDVMVYAHLAPLVKLPFPSKDIPSVLASWPNLIEFVKRVDGKYFSDVASNVKYLKSKEKTNGHNDEDTSYLAIFLLTVSATSLIVSFALKKGFITF